MLKIDILESVPASVIKKNENLLDTSKVANLYRQNVYPIQRKEKDAV